MSTYREAYASRYVDIRQSSLCWSAVLMRTYLLERESDRRKLIEQTYGAALNFVFKQSPLSFVLFFAFNITNPRTNTASICSGGIFVIFTEQNFSFLSFFAILSHVYKAFAVVRLLTSQRSVRGWVFHVQCTHWLLKENLVYIFLVISENGYLFS